MAVAQMRCAGHSTAWRIGRYGTTARARGRRPQRSIARVPLSRTSCSSSTAVKLNETPLWQRRGTAIYWEHYEKVGHNPLTGEDVTATRRRMLIDSEPPSGDEYSALIQRLLAV